MKGMDHAGEYIERLTSNEFQTVFELVAAGRGLQSVISELPKRNKTTVSRAYKVVCALHRHGTGPLGDEEADQIAETARYSTTRGYVQTMFIQYKAWDQERQWGTMPKDLTVQEKSLQILEQAKRQKVLEHHDNIRRLAGKLRQYLPFWQPQHLYILNISSGIAVSLLEERPPLEWLLSGHHHWLRKLDEQFAPLIQHLDSSGERHILEELKTWQELGGACIEKCHNLYIEIKREAERKIGLKTVSSAWDQPAQRGLLEEFSWTIYAWALGDDYADEYIVASNIGELCLLHILGVSNLAWVSSEEVEKVKTTHQNLRAKHRESPMAKEIEELVEQMAKVDQQLVEGLTRFSRQEIIPGRCSECPE